MRRPGELADDLPYTPHFESLFRPYAAVCRAEADAAGDVAASAEPAEAGALAKLGEARSKPPEIEPEQAVQLRDMLGDDIRRRDRLPYSERFDKLVDEFNKTQGRPLSPHLVWRLVATLAK